MAKRQDRRDPQDRIEPPNTGPPRWAIALGIVVAVAFVALIIVLHASGAIGPGVH